MNTSPAPAMIASTRSLLRLPAASPIAAHKNWIERVLAPRVARLWMALRVLALFLPVLVINLLVRRR